MGAIEAAERSHLVLAAISSEGMLDDATAVYPLECHERAVLDRRLAAALELLHDDLQSFQPLERIAGGEQGRLLAERDLRSAAGFDHPLIKPA